LSVKTREREKTEERQKKDGKKTEKRQRKDRKRTEKDRKKTEEPSSCLAVLKYGRR
jgi:hypothetical protein